MDKEIADCWMKFYLVLAIIAIFIFFLNRALKN